MNCGLGISTCNGHLSSNSIHQNIKIYLFLKVYTSQTKAILISKVKITHLFMIIFTQINPGLLSNNYFNHKILGQPSFQFSNFVIRGDLTVDQFSKQKHRFKLDK